MVIWITGLSASGKTSLCKALWLLLKPRLPELVVLDGDAIRQAFGNDLGYTEEDRVIQIRRLQGVAKILSDQGMVVLVAALYARQDLLNWNRQNIPSYVEIYLKASLDTVKQRDFKGLYRGDVKNMVGVDIPWNVPEAPDLVLDMDDMKSSSDIARMVVSTIPILDNLLT